MPEARLFEPVEPLPPGWVWEQQPKQASYGDWHAGILKFTGRSIREFGTALNALIAWSVINQAYVEPYMANNLYEFPDRVGDARGRSASVYSTVMVTPMQARAGGRRYTEDQLAWLGYIQSHLEQLPCPCGEVHKTRDFYCEATQTYLICNAVGCRNAGTRGGFLDGLFYCNSHLHRCAYHEDPRYQGMADFLPPGLNPDGRCNRWFVRGTRTLCDEHAQFTPCTHCATEYEFANLLPIGAGRYCRSCSPYTCRECERYNANGRLNETNDGQLLCSACYRGWQDGRNEEYDESVDELAPASLKVESTPDRPARVISIEMECTLGGDRLAKELYRAGLTPHDMKMGYHARVLPNTFCHVEHDSSLGRDGGELIFHRMRLDDDEEVEKLHKAVKIVRQMLKEGTLGMDTRCGLHMHIDAHKFGVGHVRNLVLLFNYMEDVIYRMGGAKYGVGHRGERYSRKLEKGDYKDKDAFGAYFFNRNGHTHALNTGNYWNANNNACGCNARQTREYEKCTCNLGKNTFEFRVWNGSANFRKIRAYAAITQSMVAFARNAGDLDDKAYPVFDYVNNNAITPTDKPLVIERLTWMFKNLYFTAAEREDVMYVIRNSSLNTIGEENVDALERVMYDPPAFAERGVPVFYGARKNPEPHANNPVMVDEFGDPYNETPDIEIDFDDEPNFDW